MTELYPLKFVPILKDKIWGGHSLVKNFGKPADASRLIGESWEISAVGDDISIISNGFLAGNSIEEIIEVYMGDLTGEAVFEKFGKEFPLLIKFIEAQKDLSVQVHPGNAFAKERHNANGKTEMWYILENEQSSKIYTGFNGPVTREEFIKAVKEGYIVSLLNVESARAGDTFFTPSGRIHAISAGTVLVEIQQSSDLTYRIYDWGRENSDGVSRELHIDLALEAIDFSATGKNKLSKELTLNKTENLVSCEFFNTNGIRFNAPMSKDYSGTDSFIAYICTAGEFNIRWNKGVETISKGETVLLPAMITSVVLEPKVQADLLEVYIDTTKDY
jgi:mannose-6-phosphate isomerase